MRKIDNIKWYSNLNDLDKSILDNNMKISKYAKGDNIFLEGTPADRVYYILSGKVSIYLSSKFYIAHQDEFFGTEVSFSEKRSHPIAARAEEVTTLICISRSAFLKLFDDNEQHKHLNGRNANLLKTILVHTNRRMIQFFERFQAISSGNLSAIANMLYIHIEKGDCTITDKGTIIKPALSEREIAEYCMCERSTVTRVLLQLAEEGIIQKRKYSRHITILDSEKLKTILYDKPRRNTNV